MKIFYDVDTQNDFMNSNGALYVPDAELIKPNLKLLTDFALNKRISIIGSLDKHFGTEEYKDREGELARWGGRFPDHCMNETKGQEKINETSFYYGQSYPHTLNNLTNINWLRSAAIVIERTIGRKYYPDGSLGLFFEKQSYDVFTNPGFETFLEIANIKQAVVYGVATDYCVKAAVLGMQKRNIQCYVVEDAIKGVFPESSQKALEEMTNAGAKLVTTKDVLNGRL
ncbi:MAG: isochorismatase family protein [archaeon]|nr:isochorismatase family protein [archaeon]